MLTVPGGKTNPLAGVNIGDSFRGGYYAGIIDTTKGNIIAADASQTGLRYALIVSPKSLESAALAYRVSGSPPSAASTRWDGLSATTAMNSSNFPAAFYCAGLSHPSDDASAWYLPALDELELLYRNFKSVTTNNDTFLASGTTFPPTSQQSGTNPSSDPVGSAYTTTVPAQTTLAAFQTGGAQVLGQSTYWAATPNTSTASWRQGFVGDVGFQNYFSSSSSGPFARPVRRLVLT